MTFWVPSHTVKKLILIQICKSRSRCLSAFSRKLSILHLAWILGIIFFPLSPESFPSQSTWPNCRLAKLRLRPLPRTSRSIIRKQKFFFCAQNCQTETNSCWLFLFWFSLQDCLTNSTDAEICSCVQGKNTEWLRWKVLDLGQNCLKMDQNMPFWH